MSAKPSAWGAGRSNLGSAAINRFREIASHGTVSHPTRIIDSSTRSGQGGLCVGSLPHIPCECGITSIERAVGNPPTADHSFVGRHKGPAGVSARRSDELRRGCGSHLRGWLGPFGVGRAAHFLPRANKGSCSHNLVATAFLVRVIIAAMLASSLLVLVGTKGKHLGWVGLLGVAMLASVGLCA